MIPQIWSTADRIFCHFGLFFGLLPPPPLTTQKIKIKKKMKKVPGDIIIIHMCHINDNHMKYGALDMEHDGQNFLSFWTIFCPNNPANQNFEKVKKKALRYYHLTQVCHK